MKNKFYPPRVFLDHYHIPAPIDWALYFPRPAPLQVEIGFGTGEYITRLAAEHPEWNFVGFEQSCKRIHKSFCKLNEGRLDNVRLLHVDARLAFERLLTPRSIEHIHCLFPCPWPKKNQVKHRLFSQTFLRLVNSRLKDGGRLDVVTDHEKFANWIREESADTGFTLDVQRIRPRYDTKFERKWLSAGRREFLALNFVKHTHHACAQREDVPVKTYFADTFVPDRFRFPEQQEPCVMIFKDFVFDPVKEKGLVHLVVAEDYLHQHMWVEIFRTHKGWCITVADGTLLIPTAGAADALALVYEGVKDSGRAASEV